MLTSYETFRLNFEDINSLTWACIIFDEVHHNILHNKNNKNNKKNKNNKNNNNKNNNNNKYTTS